MEPICSGWQWYHHWLNDVHTPTTSCKKNPYSMICRRVVIHDFWQADNNNTMNNRKQGLSATWIKCQNCFIISFTNVTSRAYRITENFQYATCHFYRTTLCVSAVFAIAGVCPSVCLSRSCIVSRRLKILSLSSFCLGPVAYHSSFLTQSDNTHLQVEPL